MGRAGCLPPGGARRSTSKSPTPLVQYRRHRTAIVRERKKHRHQTAQSLSPHWPQPRVAAPCLWGLHRNHSFDPYEYPLLRPPALIRSQLWGSESSLPPAFSRRLEFLHFSGSAEGGLESARVFRPALAVQLHGPADFQMGAPH